MFAQKATAVCRSLNSRTFHSSLKLCANPKYENPFLRTVRILGDEFKETVRAVKNAGNNNTGMSLGFPEHTDIVIVGGGAMGASIAYWLKEKTNFDAFRVVVVEKDPTYKKSSTALSVGGLRQQFSLPENIQMSLYGAEFIRTIKRRFGSEADVCFTPHGYLILASEEGAEQLIENSKLQRELGAVNAVLNKEELKQRFPWMNVDNVALGCLGLEKEGWFDPWSLLSLLRHGAQAGGAQFVKGEAVDFTFSEREDIVVEGADSGNYEGLNELVVKRPDGSLRTIRFGLCIIAAGAESAQVAQLARIGVGAGMLSIPLPVERRKRYVYRFACQDTPPGINTPLTIDPTGTYFRRDGLGGCFIAGMSPRIEDEPATDNLDVDHQYFEDQVWPNLANLVPAFNNIKVQSAWSGFYEFNTFDENGIIGPHPYYTNLYLATGFSGHGIQQAPAVGRAIAELILDGNFQTIDLTRLGFDRLIVDKPIEALTKIGIIGVPFEKGQPKVGVANGPKALRDGGIINKLREIHEHIDVKDYGDISYKTPTQPTNLPENMREYSHVAACNEQLSLNVARIINDGRICLSLGGDHAIALGTVDGHIKAKNENVCVLWIDAHADLNTNKTSSSGNVHGMPMALLARELSDYWPYLPGMDWQKPVISIRNVAYIGLRSVDSYERLVIDKLGITAFGMEDVENYGITTVVNMALDRIDSERKRSIHVSYDIDSLDCLEAPSTGTAVRGGLTLREGVHIMETVYNTGRLGAMDLVEVNPSIGNESDVRKTVEAALHVVMAAFGHSRRGLRPRNADSLPLQTFPPTRQII